MQLLGKHLIPPIIIEAVMENTGVDMSDMTVKQMTDLANFFKDIDKATSDLLFELIYKTGLLEDIITSFSKLNNNKI